MTRITIVALLTAGLLAAGPHALAQGGFPSVPGMGASGRAVPEQSRPKPRAQAQPPSNPTGPAPTQRPAAQQAATPAAPAPTTAPQPAAPAATPAPANESNDLPVSGAPIGVLVLVGAALAFAGLALTAGTRLVRRLRPASA